MGNWAKVLSHPMVPIVEMLESFDIEAEARDAATAAADEDEDGTCGEPCSCDC